MYRYLIIFRDIHREFRVPELLSVYSLFNRKVTKGDKVNCTSREQEFSSSLCSAYKNLRPYQGHTCGNCRALDEFDSIFVFGSFASDEEALQVGSRCVLVRAVIRLWGHSDTHEGCLKQALQLNEHNFKEMVRSDEESFRCKLYSYGKSYSQEETVDKFNIYSPLLLRFPGKVKLRDFKHEIWIVEDSFPKEVFVGRLITEGFSHVAHRFTLKKRMFVGTTSMDAELAFIMANMALADSSKLILDPFVGTGSILISCAVFGSKTLGSDLNFMVLKGKSAKENIWANFVQYKLQQPLGIIRADSLHTPWRHENTLASDTLNAFADTYEKSIGWLDAIVADLPYGVRESSREFVGEKLHTRFVLNHIPKTCRVGLEALISSLFDFASSALDKLTSLRHPSFYTVSASRQVLTTRFHRILFVMERKGPEFNDKVSETDMHSNEEFYHDFAAKLFRDGQRSEKLLWKTGQRRRVE
eukprot:jgi/Galph1/5589/GphlegSOOS_G4223.1